jgi:hypothetical protein
VTGNGQPQDVIASIADLEERFPGHAVCIVRRMPPGLRWCVDENTIYVRADVEPAQSSLDIAEAITQLDGYRPRLVALPGGRITDSPTVPMRAVGSG